MFLHCHW